jgi:hypothetical protein
MALYEERGEHGEYSEQIPRKWYSRFARERINLSASVEEALIDNTSQEPQWQDDSESDDEHDGRNGQQTQAGDDQHDTVPYTGYSKALIPPRLSLQSRVLPALSPGGFVEAATNARAQSFPSTQSEVQQEQQSSTTPHGTSLLMRLAQRITSSFSALGGTMPPEIVGQSEPLDKHETPDSSGSENAALPLVHRDTTEAPMRSRVASEQRSGPIVKSSLRAEENAAELTQSNERKQRLGRTTRVRLETAPQAQGQVHEQVSPVEIPMHTQHVQDEFNVTSASQFSEMDLRRTAEEMTRSRIMALRVRQEKQGTTSVHLPAVDVDRSKNVTVEQAKTGMLLGNGAFECGQQETTILDQRVTDGCMVQLMLLNDPGPVVVHYVSLQPHIGFTAHLTAPAVMQTGFNYVIFAGIHR